MAELNAWIVTIVILLVSFVCYKRRMRQEKEDDPFAIEPCPNPGTRPGNVVCFHSGMLMLTFLLPARCLFADCIRCRKYAQVNESAQKRLSIMQVQPERLVQALKVGRRGGDRRKDDVSPTIGQYPTVLLIPGLAARPIVTDLHRQACDSIKKHAGIILQEYLEANPYASWLQNDVVVQNDASAWNVFHFMNQGSWNEDNIALCPETTKAVQSLDIMDGCIFGNVFLSVLTNGTTIEPHCGPTNARHRLHLALQIPSTRNGEKEPVLTVLQEKVTWKEGLALVFDDSLTHSVDYPETTSSTTPRVVLIVDLWHPDLTTAERKAIQELYPTL